MTTAEAVADYHRLLEAEPASAADQARWLEEVFVARGITFDGGAMQSLLRPHFVTAPEWDRLRGDGRRLLELAARVARQVFDGDVGRLGAFLGTPEGEARWIALDPGPPDVVLSRLDAFLTPSGPRFIEINSDAPAGFGYGDRMAEVFQELPVFRAFAARRRVSYEPSGDALVAAVHQAAGRRPVRSVAIVDWAEVKTRADQEILCARFRAAGLDCVLADPRDARLAGGRLHLEGREVDVVYRRTVLSEVVAREGEVKTFLEAYRQGAAVFVNSFRCHLSEDKAFFAILTDEAFAGLLSAEERAFVARVVPWTRRVAARHSWRDGLEVDLVPHVIERREELVLKPAHGYGGRSVLVGDETSAAAWEQAVLAALHEPWVVQERVPIPEELFPVFPGGRLAFESLKVNVNPFYVRGAEVGAVTRTSRSAVINVSAGGGSVPTFVVG